ncbi:MAG: GTP-binding protein [Gammaproteobacteria bacterium]|nr:GTP-binding protein [Gammaproteobacteria bacterium]
MTPLTVLGGYLGAGKTTIINRLLANLSDRDDQPRVAVLVNDFGAINVDARLIRKHRGRTLEMTSGCVCCDIRDDLGSALDTLRGESFDQVLIEASGVAYPAKVANYAVTWPGYRPAGILVVVDALNIDRLKGDKFVGHLVNQQISEADLLLVTKLDQLDDEQARTLWDSLPERSVRVDHGRCHVDLLLATTATGTDTPRDGGTVEDHNERFHTFSYQTDRVLDHRRLEMFLNDLPEPVVRAKGWVHDNEGNWWLQSVGHRWTLEAADDIPSGTSLVFITLANNGTPLEFERTLTRYLDGVIRRQSPR